MVVPMARSMSVQMNVMDRVVLSTRQVVISSPYFIPGTTGVKAFAALTKRGVEVVVLTNSLATNDVPITHIGYARYRAGLVRAGVELYELSPAGFRHETWDAIPGLSHGRLHAKVAVVDRRWLLVGSMNMDGRSSRSNTELSLVVDDIALATAALALMQQRWSDSHYRLRIGAHDDRIEWIEPDEAEPVIHSADPQVSWLSRLRLGVLSMFVAEDLL